MTGTAFTVPLLLRFMFHQRLKTRSQMVGGDCADGETPLDIPSRPGWQANHALVLLGWDNTSELFW